MNISNEELLKENVQLLTNILADQTTTLKSLIKASEILNERIKKFGRRRPGVKPRVSVPSLSQSSPQSDS